MLTKNNLNSTSKETSEEASISHLKSYKLYVDAKEYIKTEGPRLCKKVLFVLYSQFIFRLGQYIISKYIQKSMIQLII